MIAPSFSQSTATNENATDVATRPGKKIHTRPEGGISSQNGYMHYQTIFPNLSPAFFVFGEVIGLPSTAIGLTSRHEDVLILSFDIFSSRTDRGGALFLEVGVRRSSSDLLSN